MGYTIYWKPKRKFSQSELDNMNVAFNRVYGQEIKKIQARGLSTETHEWVSVPMSNNEFEFMKTARKPYDYAVKKALIEVQRISNNGYDIKCDDGFRYTKLGLWFDGNGYTDDYKPVGLKKHHFNLSDLPIKYKIRNGEMYENGEYYWNEGKKPMLVSDVPRAKKPTKLPPPPNGVKLYKGERGGIYYINSHGHKVYCDKHCCKR